MSPEPSRWNAAEIRQRLAYLAALDPQLPPQRRRAHGYRLEPPIAPDILASIERSLGIMLPEPYRGFILEIGDGGAGPGPAGIWRFGATSPYVAEHARGFVSTPWPHQRAWNPNAAGSPSRLDDDAYFAPSWIAGSIGIADQGCGYETRLVVTGEARGQVWEDGRANDGGLIPVADDFAAWYLGWLDEVERIGVQV